jgi:tetratricopeptide (TPR) repeat protein
VSLERFIDLLTRVAPDVTSEEIADALWLASQLPMDGASRPTPLSDPVADMTSRLPPLREDSPGRRRETREGRNDPATEPPVVRSATSGSWVGMYASAGRADGVAGIRSPRVAALPRQLEFARALRRFKRSVRARHDVLLDEEATADQVARQGVWLPVLTPAPARWLDIALVVDDGPSMAIWQDTIAEFRAMLEFTAAFGDVRVWRIDTDAPSGAPFLLSSDAPAEQTMARSPWELIDPARRRIIVVVSDGIGRAWRDRRMSRLLDQWGRCGHVSVVQPLPQRLWQRCAPAVAAVRVQASEPAMENHRIAVRYRHVADPGHGYRHSYGAQPSKNDGIPIPVFELDPRWLDRWAQIVAGTSGADITVMFTQRTINPQPDTTRSVSALERVTRFRASASDEAFQLAGYLAFAPLTAPVMRLVQEAMLPSSRVAHLAEVLLGGLLMSTRGSDDTSAGKPDHAILYEFHPGVRDLLRSTVRRSTAVRVLHQVSRYVSRRLGRPIDFPALLDVPADNVLAELAQLDRPFAIVARSALRGLGGRYADIADRLGKALDPLPSSRLLDEESADPSSPSVPGSISARPYTRHAPGDGNADLLRSPYKGGEVPPSPHNSRPSGEGRRGNLPAVWVGVPQRNPYFTGREDLLRDIHERLTGKVTALVPHTLHGHGGVGKTHLAIEYVHRYQTEYDLVCWISAEQPAIVRTSIADLAKRLDLPALSVDDAVRSVLTALRRGEPYDRWLLIFDNANRPEEVVDYFPEGSGHVLLTSRNDLWAGTAQVVEVDVFLRDESIDFMRGRLGDIDERDAGELAARLDDLPLALEQAAAWQVETHTSIRDYTRLFDQRMTRLENVTAVQREVRPADYPLPVAVTWSLALDRLRETQPEVGQMLQLCAFFAPEPIPWNLFSVGRFVRDLPEELRRAISSNRDRDRMIREIKKYALAQVDYGSNRLQLHRLAQVVLREQLPSDDERSEVRHQAHMLIAAADPGDPDVPANWERYRELWPHVEPSGSVECTDDEVRELVLNLTRYLYVQGGYDAGRNFAEVTLRLWRERFEPEDQSTLILIRHLATILRALGHVDEARDYSTASYEKLREVFGDEDEETLSAGNVVGAAYRDLGQFAEALALDEDLYARHCRVFGDEHPRTLMSANNLGLDYFLMGDYRKAVELDARILQTRRRILGETNPFTLLSEYSYARDLREAGEYWQAKNLLEVTLERSTSMLGMIHPDTLRVAKHLAVARRKVGDYEAARTLSEQTFTAYQSGLGANHPDTLAAAGNLVNDRRLTRDFDAAAALAADTLRGYRAIMGESHPFTLSTENNYAIVLRQSGRLEEARELSGHALAGFRTALGPGHPYTLSAITTHANDLHAAGDYAGSLRLLEPAYDMLKNVLGRHHPYTLACGVNLIGDLRASGFDDRAATLGDVIRERYAEVLGAEHPEVIAGRTLGVRGECSTEAFPT